MGVQGSARHQQPQIRQQKALAASPASHPVAVAQPSSVGLSAPRRPAVPARPHGWLAGSIGPAVERLGAGNPLPST